MWTRSLGHRLDLVVVARTSYQMLQVLTRIANDIVMSILEYDSIFFFSGKPLEGE